MDPEPSRLKPPTRRKMLTDRRRKVISLARRIAYVAGMMRIPALLALALANASPATATTQDDVLSASLHNGWQMESGAQMAALELVLAPGWKTYWRSPGESGIPPSFDWSGSRNVKSVLVHWPSPFVFDVNGMQTIGYRDRLILPLEVTAIDPARPVSLSLQMELGVCDDICLPANLSLETSLATPGAADEGIRSALSRRPKTGGQAGVTQVSCQIDPIADGLRLTARMRLPDPGNPEVVAFETSDPAIWIAEATTQREGGDLVTMTELVPPDGAPFALDRSGVTMTILSRGKAIEVKGCPAP